MIRSTLLIISLLVSFSAHAESRQDKSLVIADIADKLVKGYASRVQRKVIVMPPQGDTDNFTSQEKNAVRDQFISGIQKAGYTVIDIDNRAVIEKIETYQGSGAVADKDVQGIGQKAGAEQIILIKFRDLVGKIDAKNEDVTLTADLTATDIKSGKVERRTTAEVKYEHEIYNESYYARDTGIGVLATVKYVALGASAYFVYVGSQNKTEAGKAEAEQDFEKQEKLEKTGKDDYNFAAGAFGLFVTSWWFQNKLESVERDQVDYHRYEISLFPDFNPGFQFTLNF